MPLLHQLTHAEVAAHLRDRVIPRVPVRQWVLWVPKRLRPALARDGDLGLFGRIGTAEARKALERRARDEEDARVCHEIEVALAGRPRL